MPVTITPAVRKRILAAAMVAERDPSAGLTVAMLAEHTGMSDKHTGHEIGAVDHEVLPSCQADFVRVGYVLCTP